MKHLLYDWGHLNVWLFQAINGHQVHALDPLMVFGTHPSSYWSFGIVAGAWPLFVVLLRHNLSRDFKSRAVLQ